MRLRCCRGETGLIVVMIDSCCSDRHIYGFLAGVERGERQAERGGDRLVGDAAAVDVHPLGDARVGGGDSRQPWLASWST